MGTFAMIVAAVVLVLAVGIGIAFWFAKRWLARRVGDWSVACELVDAKVHRAARLKLQQSSALDLADNASAAACQEAFQALGFRKLMDYETDSLELPMLRALVHPSLPIAAALIPGETTCHFECFAITEDNRVMAVGTGPTPAAQSQRLRWVVDPAITVPEAVTTLREHLGDAQLRPMDVRLFRAAYEQAYAARMDAELARAPSREALEARGRERQPPATETQIAIAVDAQRSAWLDQVEEAALDRFRRTSGIDAVTWERTREELQVVHDQLPEDHMRDLLVWDDASELAFEQTLAQGLQGRRLYEQVSKRLPAASRRQRLGEVRFPVAAAIYGVDLDQAEEDAPGESYEYVYQALDAAQGRAVSGKLMASSTADAKRQLQDMGLTDTRIVIDPTVDGGQLQVPADNIDTYLQSIGANWWQNLLMMIRGNWLLWLPPLLLVLWSLGGGRPFGWGDHLAFTYLAVALLGTAYLIVPALAYDALIRARNSERWQAATILLKLCKARAGADDFYRQQLELEGCKILVGRGESSAALERWHSLQGQLSEVDYNNGLTALYGAAGDWPRVIATQRHGLSLAPDPVPVRVDLAMSLARFTDEVDEAEALIGGLNPNELSELVLGGFMYTRGLIALKRGQLQVADRQLSQAVEHVKAYEAGPAVAPWGTEIRAFLALTWKRAGKGDAASSLWEAIESRLRYNPLAPRLVAEYRAATPEEDTV